jgi:hypothetical protein
MGGKPWKVTAPWAPDMQHVLATTRARVFAEGSYRRLTTRTFGTLAELDAFFMRGPDDPDFDENEDWSGAEEGTCSILDIRGLVDDIEPGCAAPLSDASALAIFGSTRPRESDLTPARESAIYDLFPGRGESLFVLVHDDHGPTQVVFYGYSWD